MVQQTYVAQKVSGTIDPFPAERSRLRRIVKRTGLKGRKEDARSLLAQVISGRKFVLRRHKQSGHKSLPEKPRTPSLTTVFSRDETFSTHSASDSRLPSHMSESDRMVMKVGKVRFFWTGQTLMIPNVFRLTAQIHGNNQSLLEHQDLSRKEVLAQNGGAKARVEPVVVTQPSTVRKAVAKKRPAHK